MKKKAQISKIGMGIISLILIIMMGLFLIIFYDQTIAQYLIEPLHDIAVDVAVASDIPQEYQNTIDSIDTSYQARSMPFDVFFIVAFLIGFIGSTISAAKARKAGVFSFFGYIFMLSMLFLIAMFFISQFTDYFFTNIFTPIFSDTTLDTPLLFFFFNNINKISFIWFLWLGLINIVDIKNLIREKVEDIGGGFQR